MNQEIIRALKLYELLGVGDTFTKNLVLCLDKIDFSDISNIFINENINLKTLKVKKKNYPVYINKNIIYEIYNICYKNNEKVYLSKVEDSIIECIKYKLLEYHNIKNIDDIEFKF